MIRRLLKFLRLSGREKLFLITALGWMIYYRLALKTTPLQELLAATKRRAAAPGPDSGWISLDRAAGLTNAAGRLVPFATCLSKTLAGHVILARAGHQTSIHIGVTRDQEAGFGAHAWLSWQDRVVVGSLPDLEKYRELPVSSEPHGTPNA